MADPTFEVYKDRGGEHRWRLKASNGRLIADSGEGYKTASAARQAVERVKTAAPKGKLTEAAKAVGAARPAARRSATAPRRAAASKGTGAPKPAARKRAAGRSRKRA